MKRLALIWLLLTAFAFGADYTSGPDVMLVWDAPTTGGTPTGYKVYKGTETGVYDAPVTIGNVTSYTFEGLSDDTYYFAVRAFNGDGDGDLSDEISVEVSSGADTTDPEIAIASPTADATYETAISTITLGGTSSDDVAVDRVTWSNSAGGSGTATGTTAWAAVDIAVYPGENVITVTVYDTSENDATDAITVTYSGEEEPSDYYASASGSGEVCTNAQPCTVAQGISMLTAGDTLWLKDGTYTGDDGMISIDSLDGTAENRITIKAVNDGAVNLNGEGARRPIDIVDSSYITVEGVNAYNSAYGVVGVRASDEESAYDAYIELKRIVAWDAADEDNRHVFVVFRAHHVLLEDCAGFGIGRKIFSVYESNYATVRRCWGRWTAYTDSQPKSAFDIVYDSKNGIYENIIAEFDGTSAGAIKHAAGTSGGITPSFEPCNTDTQVLGSIAILKTGDSAPDHLWYMSTSSEEACNTDTTFAHVVGIVQPSSSKTLPFYLNDSEGASASSHLTSIYGTGGVASSISASWNNTSFLEQATVGAYDLYENEGDGATIKYRYEDGELTATELWPWPMADRIKAALNASSYDTDYDIDATIEGLFGEYGGEEPPADTTNPSVIITVPTSSATYETSDETINLGGSASDNVGVSSVTWSCDVCGSGSATGTTSWTIADIALEVGANVITVTATDAASNDGTDVITITRTEDSTDPEVAITAPTAAATWNTSGYPLVDLGGTASDDVEVAYVEWENDRGGSGVCNGTTTWTYDALNLYSGDNVITVTVYDTAGNYATDSITVTYTPAVYSELTDEFAAATEQNILSGGDGAKLYGWNLLNGAQADAIDVNSTNAGYLTINHDGTNTDMFNAVFNAPFIYKEVTGDFDIEVYMDSSGPASNYEGGNLVARDPDASAGEDHVRICQYWTGGEGGHLAIWAGNTANGTSAEGYNAEATNPYMRMTRVGNVFTLYSKAALNDAWTQRAQYTRNDFAETVQLGIGATTANTDDDLTVKFGYFNSLTGEPASPTSLEIIKILAFIAF